MASALVKGTGDILVTITLKAVTKFCGCMKEILSTINSFNDRLRQLSKTIASVNSILNDEKIKQCHECPFKHTLGRLKNAVEEAEKFANKCSKVAWWNCYKKYIYAKEMANLNDSLSILLDKLELGFENVNLLWRIDAMNERLDIIILLLAHKSDPGVVSRIREIFESVSQKIYHQLTSIAERRFSRNVYHRLSITN